MGESMLESRRPPRNKLRQRRAPHNFITTTKFPLMGSLMSPETPHKTCRKKQHFEGIYLFNVCKSVNASRVKHLVIRSAFQTAVISLRLSRFSDAQLAGCCAWRAKPASPCLARRQVRSLSGCGRREGVCFYTRDNNSQLTTYCYCDYDDHKPAKKKGEKGSHGD